MAAVLSPVHADRLPAELLERAGVQGESVVMLESTAQGALVRKLKPTEKNEYQLRIGENVVFLTTEDFDEALMALPREPDAE